MNDNAKTLETYEHNASAYIDGTRQVVAGDNKDWLDRTTGYLPPSSTILELGSGFGRDATYLENLGYGVICSDAVPRFVTSLRESGHNTQQINVLKDKFGGPYNLVLANMVLLHFDTEEVNRILNRVRTALTPQGVFSFSVRRGKGTEWSNDKLGAPRYYKYWSHSELWELMDSNDFDVVDMRNGDSTNLDKIYVIAKLALQSA